MTKYEFTLILEGLDFGSDEAFDALFEAGCDDGTFGESDGVQYADFHRTARSLAEAIGSAKRAVESAVPGLRVVRVEPEDLVTASDIARRTGRTRESIRLLVAGERGPGGFPSPVTHARARNRMWRWLDVAGWFEQALGEQVDTTGEADFIAAFNSALELRRMTPRLRRAHEREEVDRVVREAPLPYG